jgi:hypothetical protein
MTGPITIDSTDTVLDEGNVLQFLLVDQYEIDDSPTRIDLLDEVARGTIDRVLGGDLPNPTVVARELGPVAAQGRLAGWSADPTEQDLFERVKLAASLPDVAALGTDGYAVALNNAGANKLDTVLGRDITYEAVVDPETGAVDATLTVTLLNDLPDTDIPDSVIGNYTGDNRGTNRTLLTLYTPLDVTSAAVSGGDLGDRTEPVGLIPGDEAGWSTHSIEIAVPPGEPVTLTVDLTGIVDPTLAYSLIVRPHPLVVPEHHRIDVSTPAGDLLVGFDDVIDRTRPFTSPLAVSD